MIDPLPSIDPYRKNEAEFRVTPPPPSEIKALYRIPHKKEIITANVYILWCIDILCNCYIKYNRREKLFTSLRALFRPESLLILFKRENYARALTPCGGDLNRTFFFTCTLEVGEKSMLQHRLKEL